ARRTHVWVVTGSLTSLLRHRWGLNLGDHNRKSRDDHRHHAIDATVIGVIDRSLVQRLSTIAAKEEREGIERRLADLDEPFDGFVDQVRARIDTLMVTHRAKHGHFDAGDPSHTSGKLHEDTYYGKVRDTPENAADLELGNVVRRKPVVDLKPNEIGKVRDLKLRAELAALLERIGKNEKALAAALAEWSSRTGVRRVRVLKPEEGVTPIRDRKTGQPYKYVVPAENAWIDIVETPDGVWRGAAVDSFAANSGGADGWQTKYPDATFIMRLRKGDVVQLFDADGVNSVKKVYRIGVAANRLYLAPANESGELQKRHDDKDDLFRWDLANIGKLKERRARRVRFTPAGRMKTVPHGMN
ncbi:MAG: hypothetical protein RIC52_11000, partial [Amphiplicatus sp.]